MALCKHDLSPYGCAACQRLPLDVPEPEEAWSAGHRVEDNRPGWHSANDLVREMEKKADALWTPELVSIEDLMSDGTDSVGGIVGLHPEYHVVRSGLISLGSRGAA